MRILLTLFVLFLLQTKTFGQLAIINDKDGYVNIREDRDSKSKIVGRLFTDDIFMVASDSDKDEWWGVFYSVKLNDLEKYKKDYYIKNGLTDGKEVYFQGYIHLSRFILIDNLKSVSTKNIKRSKNLVSIINDTIKLVFKTADFDKAKHLIKTDKNGFVVSIDNKIPKGVYNTIPKTEIVEISLTINDKKVEFPDMYYKDLFEPNLDRINLYKDSNGDLILSMPYNSDGAGAYFAAWLIKKGTILKRYTDSL